MQKLHIFTLALSTLFLHACTGDVASNEKSNELPLPKDTAVVLNYEDTKSPVKKEEEKPVASDAKKNKLADIFVYSKSGKLVEKITYVYVKGKPLKNVYKYNSDGKKTALDKYNENGVMEERIVFHDEADVVAPKKENKKEELPYKFAYKFNEQGKRTEWKSYNQDGSLGHSFTYKYDKQGREIEWKSIGESGEQQANNLYFYDDQGRKSEWQHFNEKNEMDYKYIYHYDANGKQSAELIQLAPNDKLFESKEIK